MVLSKFQCNARSEQVLLFERLSVAPTMLSKRRRFRRKVVFSDEEYPKATLNMTEHDRAQLAVPHYDYSKHEHEQDGGTSILAITPIKFPWSIMTESMQKHLDHLNIILPFPNL